jgi:1,2-diacylglycerol 3-beta-glucosyltransferase
MIWAIFVGLLTGFLLAFGGYLKSKKMTQDLENSEGQDCVHSLAVVIAAKNEEKVIEKTIRSVVDNSLNNIRLIVVNDRSTDKTQIILDRLHKEYKNLIILSNKGKPGKSDALNTALEVITEDIVLFLDADARVNASYLINNCRFFNNLDVDVVFTNFESYNTKKNLAYFLQELYFSFSKALLYSGLITKGMFMNSGVFIRRSVLEKAGKFDPNTLVDDFDLVTKLWKMNKKIKFTLNEKCRIQYSNSIGSLFHQHSRWYMGGTKKSIDILKKGNILGLAVLVLIGGLVLFPIILLVMSLFVGMDLVILILALFFSGMYSVSVFSYLFLANKRRKDLFISLFIAPPILYVFFQITVLFSFFNSFKKNIGWYKVPRNNE